MATINPLFGRMKGKYGGSVMYSNNGKQCMRERVLEVRNPRSSKQAIQRAIAATVTRFVSAFAPILNNSIQNESTRAKTLAKVRSLNMNMLRQLASQNLGYYTEKGSQFVAPNDYLISRGTLSGISPLRSDAARALLNGGYLVFEGNELVVSTTATASQAFPNIAVGDQITLLGSWMEDFAVGSRFGYCRFAFKDDTTPVFIEDEGFYLNPAAIDLTKADGPWDKIEFTTGALGSGPITKVCLSILAEGYTGDPIDMGGLIVSREAGKMRSTSYMVSKAADEYALNLVYPTYMGGGTQIDMPSDVYLDNDAYVAPPSPNDLIGITMNDSSALVLPHQFGTSVSAATIMVLVPKLDYSLPANFTVRVNYTAGDVAKVASFSPNDTATIDDVTWQVSGANIQINRAEQTGGTNQVTVTSVTYIDRAAGINKTWE